MLKTVTAAVVVSVSAILAPAMFGQSCSPTTPSFDSALRACAANAVCDLTGFSGTCAVSSSAHVVSIPTGALVKLGRVTVLTSDVIKLGQYAALVGQQGANGPSLQTTIQASSSFTPGAVVELDGGGNLLEYITVDGNKASQSPSAGFPGIFINRSNRVELHRVRPGNNPGAGILIYSDAGLNQSGNAKFDDVESFANQFGLLSNNTTDGFVSLSEFENNDLSGMYLQGSAGWRIEHSDFGGNGTSSSGGDGITGDNGACGEIVVGTQVQHNSQKGINLPSSNSTCLTTNQAPNVVTGDLIINNGNPNNQW